MQTLPHLNSAHVSGKSTREAHPVPLSGDAVRFPCTADPKPLGFRVVRSHVPSVDSWIVPLFSRRKPASPRCSTCTPVFERRRRACVSWSHLAFGGEVGGWGSSTPGSQILVSDHLSERTRGSLGKWLIVGLGQQM